MHYARRIRNRSQLLATSIIVLVLCSRLIQADTGTCGSASITLPFTDVQASNIFFCSIASAYFSGLTNGTSATTYSPSANVPREQMAAFVTRTLDQSLRRGADRAALDQWWTQTSIPSTATTDLDNQPKLVRSDGGDVWAANFGNGTVSRVRASDGQLHGTWTGAYGAYGVLVARGRIYVSAGSGRLFSIDPTQPPGAATLVTDELGPTPHAIAYDGSRIWTSNYDSISSVNFGLGCILGNCVNTFTSGFSHPTGILYDGSNIWVTDEDGGLKKMNSNGSIALTLSMGTLPNQSVFDGINIWVPNFGSDSVTVVRVKDSLGNPLAQPFVLATLTGNGLDGPRTAAFDGQRILVTNNTGSSVSLWKATDLTPLGSFSTGADTGPFGACSDGINFWITLNKTDKLARF
jgi:hypothetical protein